jgi:hypothetical protein
MIGFVYIPFTEEFGQFVSIFITTKSPPVVTPQRLIAQVIVVTIPGQVQDLCKELLMPFLQELWKTKGKETLEKAAHKISASKRSNSRYDLADLDSDSEDEAIAHNETKDRQLEHFLRQEILEPYEVEADYVQKMQVKTLLHLPVRN